MLPVATSSTKLIACAAKLPVLSRLTRVFGTFKLVPVALIEESTYAFVATSVGFVTTPVIVIIFVVKSPVPFRNTIVFGTFELVAVVAEFATLPAVDIVANLVSTIPATGETSALTINDELKLPNASLCTIPAGVKDSITISLIDNIPLTEPSTIDISSIHKSDTQFVTVKLSITASVILTVINVASVIVNPPASSNVCATISSTDKVPLIEPSIIDIVSRHKSDTQFVTVKLSTVISESVSPPAISNVCATKS